MVVLLCFCLVSGRRCPIYYSRYEDCIVYPTLVKVLLAFDFCWLFLLVFA